MLLTLFLTGCWMTRAEVDDVFGGKGGEADADTDADTDTDTDADTDSDTDSDADSDVTPLMDCTSIVDDEASAELIPSQEFEMGCTPGVEPCESDESPVHTVRLTHCYFMDITEVTQGEFNRLMSYEPSYFSSCGTDCPVETVSWHEAAAYANERSDEDGLARFYACVGSGEEVDCEASGDSYTSEGWRLPTEAEWEAAARCGTDLKYAGSDDIDEVAWYGGGSGPKPVGGKDPNGWGLYDMSGNVFEWVHDWYGSYDSGDAENPSGEATDWGRVLRGGSGNLNESEARVSNRLGYPPESIGGYLGFRLMRPIQGE